MAARAPIIQPFPTVIGACADVKRVRGWMIVLLPSLMGWVPVRVAEESITRLGERMVGGLGVEGCWETRRVEDIFEICSTCCWLGCFSLYLFIMAIAFRC